MLLFTQGPLRETCGDETIVGDNTNNGERDFGTNERVIASDSVAITGKQVRSTHRGLLRR